MIAGEGGVAERIFRGVLRWDPELRRAANDLAWIESRRGKIKARVEIDGRNRPLMFLDGLCAQFSGGLL